MKYFLAASMSAKSIVLALFMITLPWLYSGCGKHQEPGNPTSVQTPDAVVAEKKQRHWQQVIISACEQCGRNQLPELKALTHLDSWLDAVIADFDSFRVEVHFDVACRDD